MTRIPKTLHYIWIMARGLSWKQWGLVHYLCVKSAVERIRPNKVYFYYEVEPAGQWWRLTRELVTPIKIKAPREIFGRPIRHVAHCADVVRLQKLSECGGIYLDCDVLVHRDFDQLLNESTVLGCEGEQAEHGMTNAVILAEPEAPFIRRWLESYRSFRSEGRDQYWNEHSVQLPAKLARAFPDEITVLPHTAFYWPLWTPEHLDWIFRSTQPIPLDHTYANHLWESKAAPFLDGLTVDAIRSRDSNFHFWARPLLESLPDDYRVQSVQDRMLDLKYRFLQSTHLIRTRVKHRFRALAG